MKKVVSHCLVLAASVCLNFGSASGQSVPETIDELLKAYSSQGVFNGTALVAQNGVILLQKGYGYRNLKTRSAHDSSSVFQVSSLTKQFTAVIILQLQEKKLLSVQDKVSKYLTDFPGGDQITIDHLLTHSSGLVNYTDDTSFVRRGWVRQIGRDSLLGFFENKPLEFMPGQDFRFSNSGYLLLGYIIEKITGKSYYQVIREEIFEPLGMTHSGFDFRRVPDNKKSMGNLAISGTIADSTLLFAAGAMYSTAADLYRWNQALWSGRLLTDSSLQRAFTPKKGKYGYGWFIDSTYGNKILMHEGGILDFVSFMAVVPANQTCIILLDNNQSQALAKIGEDIYSLLNDQAIEWPRTRPVVHVDATVLKQYVGSYQFSQDFRITITLEGGHLVAQPTGQGKVELFPEKNDLFFTKVLVTELEFSRDIHGKVSQLVLYQGDSRIQGQKTK
jgi:CubicO group peptidase (beta-lactamase class C family)